MKNFPTSFNADVQTLPVYAASGLRVTDGVNFGDQLSDAEELVLDDVYSLDEITDQIPLTITQDDSAQFTISKYSKTGAAGNPLHLDCAITLMGPDGIPFDAVILVEVDKKAGTISEIYLLPLAPLRIKTGYRLVGIDRKSARARMAEAACVNFTRGTHITMANGQQRPVEELCVGDRVLTRDDGMQTIRWVGQSTMRAVGEFAPVVITKGTLGNENDLAVSPNQRLFIYQRVDALGAGRKEVLVKAKHLVNGGTITRQTGGFVDYFQLLFDDHQIIFAEGIATESLILNERTTPALPKELAQQIGHGLHLHQTRPHESFEIEPDDTNSDDIAERLRRASFI